MNELDLMVRAPSAPSAVVPMDYAEKAMGSLMQLHSELMEEKERRVDLYRRLMEREQAVAELRMYVKILEEKIAAKAEPPPAVKERVRAAPRVAPKPPPPPPRPLKLVRSPEQPRPAPPIPPAPVRERVAPASFSAADGWKAW